MPDPEKTMTRGEWMTLYNLAMEQSERVGGGIFKQRYLDLADKCRVRASAAQEGRCIP